MAKVVDITVTTTLRYVLFDSESEPLESVSGLKYRVEDAVEGENLPKVQTAVSLWQKRGFMAQVKSSALTGFNVREWQKDKRIEDQ